MNKNWKLLLVCGLIVSGSMLVGAEMKRPPEMVKAGKVENIARERSRKYVAKISAVDDVSLIARVSGVLLEQKFANGAFVKKDQVLFLLEDTSYRAAKDSAKAKLAQAEATLLQLQAEYTFAKSNLERQERLWKQKAVSDSARDDAVRMEATVKASIEAAKASIEAAKAALVDAENNLSYTKIVSPINGKAGKAACSPGNYVTPANGTLINIVSMDQMYVNFWISMSDYLAMFDGNYEKLRKEAIVKVFLADGSEFRGQSEVVFIDNRVDKDTDTIRVRLCVKNEGMKLLPDSLVTVKLSRKDGLKTAVPVSAIMNNGQISFVYVLDAAGKAAVRPVKLGEMQGKNQIVLEGLQGGETVVVDGTHKVFPGSVVNPVM